MRTRTALTLALIATTLPACDDDDGGGASRADASQPDSGMDASAGAHDARDAAHDASPPSDAAARHDSGASNDAGGGIRAVTIRFRASIGGAEFACGRDYANQGSSGTTITPVDFRFYVQDLKLVTASGDEVAVTLDEREPWQSKDLAMIDFEDGTGACAGTPDTNEKITGHVPAGDYAGVRFTNGVPEALNHDDPTTLPPVLQIGGFQWTWLTGFRFMKAEVQQVLDADADAGAIPGYGLVHPGAVGCSGNPSAGDVKCEKPNRNAVRLDHFDPDHDVIAADLGAIFGGSDLSEDCQCHGVGDACAAIFPRLGIDADSGRPLLMQQTYRVE